MGAGWKFIGQILKKYEPKKNGGKTKKPPKAVLDALQTGLKQGLSDSDKATQKEAMNVLNAMSLIDEARAERMMTRMSPTARRNFEKITGTKPKDKKSKKMKKGGTATPKVKDKKPKKKKGDKGKKGKDKEDGKNVKLTRSNSKNKGKKGGKDKTDKDGKNKGSKKKKGKKTKDKIDKTEKNKTDKGSKDVESIK